ncbi:acyltransferase family protein [Limimaricola pyoseonensis]|uniref:Peptidoglycan/LPS O-acetylase OafA/YrhL, contains acyltransferase and SGNH-hydrolase domains n=1 Tax=Limimaricola pyoseonensis TaxID=521013 RepID=A0A1G7IXH4_9RHOB|nr:acyltransferase family protein [Limimaricola pyoseonensis]SDF17315.1 Peptidoglycan/LPS O-acetylase OafA/YrhL, contains acyltransferase and SGNH-hydrolase domains [Limimaricola pyoseonensis]
MRYRPEIDGLRAVAVLPVILFHAGTPGFGGGFVGVDVFFVVSGYLITSILVADLQGGRFSILTFYERRARRILPALMLTLALSLPVAVAWMTPAQLADFAKALVATGVFASNVLFWMESGYFARAAELNPLLHTWSLAVEEQFYLLFPPLLWLLWRLPRRWLRPALWALAAASFALCQWLMRADASAAFYLAPARGWELLAGALCALAARPGPRAAAPLAALGLGLILAGIALIGPRTPFPSTWALLPVLGTVLVILGAGPGNAAGRLLATRPLVAIGLISYSAYLLHQPILAFARLRSGTTLSEPAMLGLALASLPLAWLSWRFVEAPFRGRVPRLLPDQALLLSVSAASLAAVVGLGLGGHVARGWWHERFPRIAAIERAAAPADPELTCSFGQRIDPEAAAACLARAGPRAAVLLGDSHAAAIAEAFHAEARARGLVPVSFHHNGCFPVPGFVRLPLEDRRHRSCERFKRTAFAALEEAGGPVVVMTRWALNLESRHFDNGLGGREQGRPVEIAAIAADGDPARDADLALVAEHRLRALAARHALLLIGPFPEAGWNVPELVAGRLRRGVEVERLGTGKDRFRERNARVHALFAALSPSPRIGVVEIASLFCESAPDGLCLNYDHGRLYYRDDDHPTAIAARMIATRALDALDARRQAAR